MSSSNGDDFQEKPQEESGDYAEVEVELETGPRAERPNFLTATRFVDFDLPPEILEGLDKAGFEYCTPIQAQAIPVAMKGDDIAGQAQTGTGKTTAFLVPLLNRLLKNKPLEPDVPRAIIVTPTRELALQIHEDATVLAGGTSLRQALVIGGMEYKEQAELLASGPEIVICTPGRIIDYLQQGVFKTKGIEVAVVDEADRLLDMGFIKDLKYLLGKLPPFTKRQTMLFSATLDERVLELTYQYMNPPQYITAEPDTSTKVNIAQELYHVGRDEKLSLLMGLLRREEHQRIIIFVNTKSGVEWLSKKLVMNGFQAEGITGDLPQPKRLKLMEAFKENRLQILVATDVASRGIHVDDVSHVYNYDLPQDAENYVHRIGRTARAGNSGKAVSFGCEDYVFHLEAIENLLGEKIPVFWAEADWFQEDQGGEVRLKDRKGDRRKSGPGSAKSSRSGDGGERGERRVSRGPGKSSRPGGIFGLSPRITGDGAEDARQVLDWAEVEEIHALPLEAAAEEAAAAPLAGDGSENGEKEGGRRRKRRRGRRGRGGETAGAVSVAADGEGAASAGASSPAAEAEAKETKEAKADLPETGKPAEAEPVKSAAAKKPRKSPARKKADSPEAQVEAASMETPPEDLSAAQETAKPKTSRTTRSGGKKTKAAEVQAESPEPSVPVAGEPAKKTGRSSKKASAPPAEPEAKAVKAPEEEPLKKPRRSSKKAAEKTEAEAAPAKPAKKTASAAKAESGEKPKKAAKKSDSSSAAAETKKTGRSAKKTDAPEEKTPKAGARRSSVKSEGEKTDGGAKKKRSSKKESPEE